MNEKLYSLEELGEKLIVNVRSLREFIKRGDLVASKIGNRYMVTETSVQEFIKSRIVQPTKRAKPVIS